MPGPPKTPTSILRARNSWRADARAESEPSDKTLAPDPPAFLTKAAREEWDYIVPRLLARRTLTESDRGHLAIMCMEYAEYVEAYRDLAKLKKSRKPFKGCVIDHPRVRIKGACDRYTKAAKEFGLTPAAKARVQATAKEKEEVAKPVRQGLRIA